MLSAILVLLVAFTALGIYLFINARKDKGQDKLVEETNRLFPQPPKPPLATNTLLS